LVLGGKLTFAATVQHQGIMVSIFKKAKPFVGSCFSQEMFRFCKKRNPELNARYPYCPIIHRLTATGRSRLTTGIRSSF
jgi:hypothetical protein